EHTLFQAAENSSRRGQTLPGHTDAPREPHATLIMLTVDKDEIGDVLQPTEKASRRSAIIQPEGHSYRHNPHGAPELYFRKTPEWINLQREVITAVEPLRRGRLRDIDPSGARIRDLMKDPTQDAARRRQLDRFGY